MPTQMPRTGRPPASRRPMILGPSTARRPVHAGGEGAHARDDEAVGVQRGLRVRGHRDVGAHPGQRPLGRAQVARPVVEDDDLLHAAHATDQPTAVRRDSRSPLLGGSRKEPVDICG